jgi:sugar/nucleoside kinase (ribokinase family)
MVSTLTIYDRIDPQKKLIAGVGSALIDILVHEDDNFLSKTGALKGGMSYVDKAFIDYTIGMSTLTPEVVPGGSACNTMVGVGRLGGWARFVGKCGNGPMGQLFRTDLQKQNVDPVLLCSDSPTGRVLSIITPDAQRSMFTFLGASSETRPHEITPACFEQAAIVHVEGYLLFNRDLITAVFKAAKDAGALISLDLASFNVVEECRDILPDLIVEFVDILIANEDEARAYSGSSDEGQALQSLAAVSDLAVLKLGERGSVISHADHILRIQAHGNGARAVDTTGAGDLWAAGFLFGLINRMPLARCGELGALCGYEVCQVVGAHISDQRWETIKRIWRNDGQTHRP